MTPLGEKDATARELPWHFCKISVGRKLSGIKAVCRTSPATAKNGGRQRPSAVRKGVTILEKCYELYAKVREKKDAAILIL